MWLVMKLKTAMWVFNPHGSLSEEGTRNGTGQKS